MLVLINYGVGNLGSILNMLKKAGEDATITSDPLEIEKATRIIIPGVGSFDYGMEKLHEFGLVNILNQKVLVEKTPVLGICLGMQLMAKSSEEGEREGLGWLDADCLKFRFDSSDPAQQRLKVPHMGWNEVTILQQDGVFKEMYTEPRFYFVHSYHVKCNHPEDIAATSRYGIEFTCAVKKGNIHGVQFHPEKSHKYGLKVLKNFATI